RRDSASPSVSKRCACSRKASPPPKTSIGPWSSATTIRWAHCVSPISSGSTSASASPKFSRSRSDRVSNRREFSKRWLPTAASGRRQGRASTTGRRSESYGAFAYAYDQALGEHFFSAARRLLDDVLYKYPARAKTHLDLACGTGYAIDYFEKRGFRSIGVDASLSMLGVARKRASRLIAADHHLEIATKYDRREKRAYGVVSGWAMLRNGDRATIHETHEQRAWSESEIKECLRAAHLEVVEVIDFDPFHEMETLEVGGVKLFFICRGLTMVRL